MAIYTGTYKIADIVFEIRSIHETVHTYCKLYRWDGEAEFVITTSQEDIAFEDQKSAQDDISEGREVVKHHPAYLEILSVYRKLAVEMIRRNTILFHGSAIAVDGQAVLFTAKSGTGKSTHTALWRERFGDRAVMVNDDKPLLRIKDDGVMVCGTPWNGKHRISTNCIVPLKAICILERGEENEICPVSPKEALPMVLQQTHRPNAQELLAQYMKMVNLLVGKVPCYRLKCNMDPEAAKVAYEGMLG